MSERIEYIDCTDRLKTVLDKVGCLTVDQAKAINNNNALSWASVKGLIRENQAFWSKERDYILSNPRLKPNKEIRTSVYAILPFLSNTYNVSIGNLYHAAEMNEKEDKLAYIPVVLGFTKGKKLYETTRTVNNSTELKNLIAQLNKRYNEMIDADPELRIRYLIPVLRDSIIESAAAQNIKFPYAFVQLKKEDGVVTPYYVSGEDLTSIEEELTSELVETTEDAS